LAAEPDPAIFPARLRTPGILPHQVLHVGDDPVVDIKQAGMRTARLNRKQDSWNHEARPDLEFGNPANSLPGCNNGQTIRKGSPRHDTTIEAFVRNEEAGNATTLIVVNKASLAGGRHTGRSRPTLLHGQWTNGEADTACRPTKLAGCDAAGCN
jgi:hypothetical protein